MRTTSSTRSAEPSTSLRQDGGVTFSGVPVSTANPRLVRMRVISGSGRSRPARRFTASGVKSIRRFQSGARPATTSLGRLAAAEVEDQFRRQFQTRHDEFGIDAALEAVARIGQDAELAARGAQSRPDRRRPIR